MKTMCYSLLLPLTFASGLVIAQNQRPQRQYPSQREAPGQQEAPGQETPSRQTAATQQKVITGRIAKSNDGKYVLTASSGTMYQLDDQDVAKKYEGKKVKVTGSVDSTDSTIHVRHIRPAK